MKYLTLLASLWAIPLFGQNRALYIMLGSPIGTLGENKAQLKSKPGFLIGGDYWVKNKKGNSWSIGATYNFFSRKNDHQKETFEYLTLRGMPIVWEVDKQKKWYFEVGVFWNYLLHQELQEGGSVLNKTKLSQRNYVGPSAGLGIRLGDKGKSQLLLGLRDDFGGLGFGTGKPTNFNTIALFAGLNI